MRNTLYAMGGLAAVAAMLAVLTVRAADPCGPEPDTFAADCDGWAADGSYGHEGGAGPFCILATVILKDGAGNEVEVQTQELTLPESTGECYHLGDVWASAPLSGSGFQAVIWEEWHHGTCADLGGFIEMFDIHGEPFDCEPPPPEGEACSPGYWKNHTELWFGVCCDEATGECDAILGDLNAKGNGGAELRQAAADLLEDCLGRPCNDD